MMFNPFLSPLLVNEIKTRTGIWGECLCALIETISEASEAVLNIRNTGLYARKKADGSPVTNGDMISQNILVEGIQRLPPSFSTVPIVSEEGLSLPPASPKGDFWLIDPLDGTKGFLSGEDEFCINIGLLKDGFPLMGIVALPVSSTIYIAVKGQGAWKIRRDTSALTSLHCQALTPSSIAKNGLRIVSSTRENSRKALNHHLKKNRQNPLIASVKELGSAVKIIHIAEGDADYYYQPGPTMAWDIAGPQIILEEAGGIIRALDGNRFSYGKENWQNEAFEALGTYEEIFC